MTKRYGMPWSLLTTKWHVPDVLLGNAVRRRS